MCTVLLPPGVNPIAVNKYIISYHIKCMKTVRFLFLTVLECKDHCLLECDALSLGTEMLWF